MNLLLHLLILLPLSAASSSSTRFLEAASSYFPSLDDNQKLAYTTWLNDHASSYTRQAFLSTASDPNEGVATFWNIDGDSIDFAIVVQADGWVGFGISEAGGMLGADVAMFQASTAELVDSYILTERAAPLPDDCQDWKLISSTTENGWIIIEMNRKLDTGDSQDHVIQNDEDLWNAPTRLIAAWGDDKAILYHGNKKAKSSVRLFGDSKGLVEVLAEESDGSFEVLEDNFEIPAQETTYHDNCKTFDELKDQLDLSGGSSMLTMIRVAPVIDEATRELIHHFAVYLQPDCSSSDPTRSMIYVWAPGAEGLLYPNDVGLPIFQNEFHQAISIEIHYNNPSKIEDTRDSSGMRFYYTKTKRTYDAGILQLGDPYVQLAGKPINDGQTSYQFTCPATCASLVLGLGNRKVTVIQEFLHMHKTGTRMTNEVIRGDQVAHESLADVYDFDQQGSFHPNQEPYELMPGDTFRTTCYYKDGNQFGLGSQEEMCIAFLTYYPAITVEDEPWICPYVGSFDVFGCYQKLESADLGSEDELGRNFGAPASECAAEPTTAPSAATQTINKTPTVESATAPSAATQTTNKITLLSAMGMCFLFVLFL